jgi:hypothetical protein
MTEQASFPELKPIGISQELSRQLEIIRESKAKPNFGFQNADSPLSTQQVTNTNPFVALEADNPKAEEEKDNLGEMKENWTFQGRKRHTPRITSPRQALPQTPTPSPGHNVTPGGRRKRMANRPPQRSQHMFERPLTIVSLNARRLGRDSTKHKLIKTWLSSLQNSPQILLIQEHHLDEQGATNSTKGMEF